MKKTTFTTTLLGSLLCTAALWSQENMQVSRARAVDFRSKVFHIAVDDNNTKWVSTDKGLFEVKAPDLGIPATLSSGEQALYAFSGGNTPLRWNADNLNKQLGGVLNTTNVITAAVYDARRDVLWIGTSESGAYFLKTKPSLQLTGKLHAGNTKLGSNTVNCMFLDARGQIWIGTDGGVLYGADGKWKVEQRYFSIQGIVQSGSDCWVLGDGFLWKVSAADKWTPVDIPAQAIEGQALALAADGMGRLWIASERVAAFTPGNDDLQLFGPGQYYTSQFPNCMVADLDGAIWVGTEDKGLYVIEKASAWNVNLVVQKQLDCNNDQPTAALEVKVSGGTPPFTYAWNSNASGATPQNLGPGVYEVTVTDSKGKIKTAALTLADPRMTASATLLTPESKENAKDGSAEVKVQGGVLPYSYRWDNGETTPKASRLGEGVRWVDILDAKGCKVQVSVEVARKPAELTLALASKKDISCFGGKDGMLALQALGGVPPYTYAWSASGISGAKAENLPAGSYRITLTDAEKKQSITEFSLEQPSALSAKAKAEKPASVNGKDGQASVIVEGGVPPYSIQWQNGVSSAQIQNLAAGTYQVDIADARGCKTNTSVQITENILPLDLSITLLAGLKCKGDASASLQVEVQGGKPPYRYDWQNPALQGERLGNLKEGTYNLVVTDAAGTSKNGTFAIKAPEALTALIQVTAPASTAQQNGQARAVASGGTAPYTYRWDNGETAADAARLAPGKRSVTITDANNCTATAEVEITENILPLSAQISQGAGIRCAGSAEASLEVLVSGGKAPFTYAWNNDAAKGDKPAKLPAGAYQLTVSDASGKSATAAFTVKQPEALSAKANVSAQASTDQQNGKAKVTAAGGTAPYTYRWDNGETAADAARLAPGKRSVTITDANNCTTTAEVEITENILPLSAQISQGAGIRCAGSAEASLEVLVSGGKAPFSYAWNNDAAKGDKPAKLPAGVYQLTVSDASGKSATATFTVKQPEALSAKANISAPASTGQQNGKAKVTAAGGTAPYTYRWDNGETVADATQLAPGKRSVTITDANNCTATAEVEITENILPLVLSIREVQKVSCAEGSDAVLAAEVSGGKPPYAFRWSSGGTSEQIGSLAAGAYQLTVTDALGSSSISSLQLQSPSPIELEWISLYGAGAQADGQATLRATGGSGQLTVRWDNGETSFSAVRLPAGARRVTVSDEKGCSATEQVEIPRRLIEELVAGKLSPNQTIQLEQVRFEVDSTNFNQASLAMLNELLEFLAKNPKVNIEIGGHTSDRCSEAFCDQLSAARAKSVADYLVRRGIEASRVSSRGYGKRNPIATNATPEGRTKNQRVEIKVLDAGS